MSNSFLTEDGVIELGEEVGTKRVGLPTDYFRLDALVPAASGPERNPPIPAVILDSLGKVKSGAHWESLGMTPYPVETIYKNEVTSYGFGSVDVANRGYSFTPFSAIVGRDKTTWKKAIANDMRVIDVPWQAYQLRTLGIPLQEILGLNEAIVSYVNARIAFDQGAFSEAVSLIAEALAKDSKNREYQELNLKYRAKAGDLSVIQDGLTEYRSDMDSAIHAGYAETWIRLSIDQGNNYALALDIVLAVLDGVDRQLHAKGPLPGQIYGVQKKSFLRYERQKFLKRLATLRGFLGKELLDGNQDRHDQLRQLFMDVAAAAPEKQAKIAKVQALFAEVVSSRG